LNLETLVWVGPETAQAIDEEFTKFFERFCMLNGSVFFQSDLDATKSWCEKRLKQKHFFGPMPSGNQLWRKVLSPGQLQRLEAYQLVVKENAALDGTFICDLDHWPDSPGPSHGPFFPCLLRHGLIMDLNTFKIASSMDRFLALGFHMTRDVSERFHWPLAEYAMALPDTVVKSVTRNSQSLPSILDSKNTRKRKQSRKAKTPAAPASPKVSTEKIERNGCLDTKHYVLLDKLPKAALPDKPPAGKHQYQLSLHRSVKIVLNFKVRYMKVVHFHAKRGYRFKGVHDIARVWRSALEQAQTWMENPPQPRLFQPPIQSGAGASRSDVNAGEDLSGHEFSDSESDSGSSPSNPWADNPQHPWVKLS
ncbi:Uncharacterized protein SCF082_LOCUS5377, partial [Durusdinium trenchii]